MKSKGGRQMKHENKARHTSSLPVPAVLLLWQTRETIAEHFWLYERVTISRYARRDRTSAKKITFWRHHYYLRKSNKIFTPTDLYLLYFSPFFQVFYPSSSQSLDFIAWLWFSSLLNGSSTTHAFGKYYLKLFPDLRTTRSRKAEKKIKIK